MPYIPCLSVQRKTSFLYFSAGRSILKLEVNFRMLIIAFLTIAALAALIYIHAAGAVIWKGFLIFVLFFAALNILYFILMAAVSLFVNNSRPVAKQSPICRAFCVSFGELMTCYCGIRAHISGTDKLPKSGRFVFVCNHLSGFDPLFVMDKLRKFNISFIAKPSLMKIPVAGKIAYGAGFLPIDRENDRNALKSIVQATDYLKRGLCSVGIYPEGTRSRSGELLPFHAGSFKIAQKANVPLAVACVRGTENVKKNLFHRRTDVFLDILELIPAENVRAMSTKELAQYSRELIERRTAVSA